MPVFPSSEAVNENQASRSGACVFFLPRVQRWQPALALVLRLRDALELPSLFFLFLIFESFRAFVHVNYRVFPHSVYVIWPAAY